MLLGAVSIIFRFMPDSSHMNYDLCDRNLYDDETIRTQKLLLLYVFALIVLHFFQWIAFMNAQRLSALEDVKREK